MYVQIPTYHLSVEAVQNLTAEKIFMMYENGELFAYVVSECKPIDITGFMVFKVEGNLSDRTGTKHGVIAPAPPTGETKILDTRSESNQE